MAEFIDAAIDPKLWADLLDAATDPEWRPVYAIMFATGFLLSGFCYRKRPSR